MRSSIGRAIFIRSYHNVRKVAAAVLNRINKIADTKSRKGSHRELLKLQGSFTVEAAFIVPIVLICILLIVNQGIELYTQTVELAQEQEVWEEFHPVKRFRELELVNDLL